MRPVAVNETHTRQYIRLAKLFDKIEHVITKIFLAMVKAQIDAKVHQHIIIMGRHSKWELVSMWEWQLGPYKYNREFVIIHGEDKVDAANILKQVTIKDCRQHYVGFEYLLGEYAGGYWPTIDQYEYLEQRGDDWVLFSVHVTMDIKILVYTTKHNLAGDIYY